MLNSCSYIMNFEGDVNSIEPELRIKMKNSISDISKRRCKAVIMSYKELSNFSFGLI